MLKQVEENDDEYDSLRRSKLSTIDKRDKQENKYDKRDLKE